MINKSIEINALKKQIRSEFSFTADSEYLAKLWDKLHELRGYKSYNL